MKIMNSLWNVENLMKQWKIKMEAKWRNCLDFNF